MQQNVLVTPLKNFYYCRWIIFKVELQQPKSRLLFISKFVFFCYKSRTAKFYNILLLKILDLMEPSTLHTFMVDVFYINFYFTYVVSFQNALLKCNVHFKCWIFSTKFRYHPTYNVFLLFFKVASTSKIISDYLIKVDYNRVLILQKFQTLPWMEPRASGFWGQLTNHSIKGLSSFSISSLLKSFFSRYAV